MVLLDRRHVQPSSSGATSTDKGGDVAGGGGIGGRGRGQRDPAETPTVRPGFAMRCPAAPRSPLPVCRSLDAQHPGVALCRSQLHITARTPRLSIKECPCLTLLACYQGAPTAHATRGY